MFYSPSFSPDSNGATDVYLQEKVKKEDIARQIAERDHIEGGLIRIRRMASSICANTVSNLKKLKNAFSTIMIFVMTSGLTMSSFSMAAQIAADVCGWSFKIRGIGWRASLPVGS